MAVIMLFCRILFIVLEIRELFMIYFYKIFPHD